MSFVLFVLGLAAAAAGVLMIGFGIPINEFSLGNTLIIAGTTALAGGLVVIGLSVVARQLSKIADLLLTRPAGPASGRSSDMLEQGGGGGRMPRAAFRRRHPADARAASAIPRHRTTIPTSYDPIEDLPPPPPPAAAAAHPRFRRAASAPHVAPALPRADLPLPAGVRPALARAATPPIEPSVRQEPRRVRSRRSGSPNGRPRPAQQEPSFDAIWPADRRAERVEPQQDFRPSRRRRRSRRGSMAMPPASRAAAPCEPAA